LQLTYHNICTFLFNIYCTYLSITLYMGEDRKTTGRRKRIVPKGQVQMIISREYIGTQTVAEAFVPIISEDIRKKIAEGDTFDNEGLSA